MNSLDLSIIHLIKWIYIDQNNIEDEGAKNIAEALKVNNTLISLNIGNLHLT